MSDRNSKGINNRFAVAVTGIITYFYAEHAVFGLQGVFMASARFTD